MDWTKDEDKDKAPAVFSILCTVSIINNGRSHIIMLQSFNNHSLQCVMGEQSWPGRLKSDKKGKGEKYEVNIVFN